MNSEAPPPRRSSSMELRIARLKESFRLFTRGRWKKVPAVMKVEDDPPELSFCLDPPRFSCDEIGQSQYLWKDPPRRSLDVKMFHEPPACYEPARRSLDVHLLCKTYFSSEGFKPRRQNVVAKLMGLDDIPIQGKVLSSPEVCDGRKESKQQQMVLENDEQRRDSYKCCKETGNEATKVKLENRQRKHDDSVREQGCCYKEDRGAATKTRDEVIKPEVPAKPHGTKQPIRGKTTSISRPRNQDAYENKPSASKQDGGNSSRVPRSDESSLMRPTIASSARQQQQRSSDSSLVQRERIIANTSSASMPKSKIGCRVKCKGLYRDQSESRAALISLRKGPTAKNEAFQKQMFGEKINRTHQQQDADLPKEKIIAEARQSGEEQELQVIRTIEEVPQAEDHSYREENMSPVSVLDIAYHDPASPMEAGSSSPGEESSAHQTAEARAANAKCVRVLDLDMEYGLLEEQEVCCEHWWLVHCKRCTRLVCLELENEIFDSLVYDTIIRFNVIDR